MKKIFLLLGLLLLGGPLLAADKPLVIESGQTKQLPAATALQLSAATTANASVNMPHGTAPTSPTNGDCWTTTTGLFCRINGATVGPYAAGAGTISLTGDVTGSGTSSIATAIGANKVTDAMIRQSAGLSLVGRSANTTGNVADITAASDNQVLRRSGTAIGFGAVNLASSSAVTGTLPVANGGTGDTGGAWTSYVPTVTAASGTLTTVSATGRTRQVGKTVFVEISVTITNAGTAAAAIKVTLPATAAAFKYTLVGSEVAATGKQLQGRIDGSIDGTYVYTVYYDNSFPGASGNVLTLSGTYEAA